MSRAAVFAALLIASLPIAGLARAGSPAPARPVAASFYSGRWFEIARTPNAMQRQCEGSFSEFEASGPGGFTIRQVCRHGSPRGPAHAFVSRGEVEPGSQNARFRLSFMGGLMHQEYWVLDHAPDGAWAIMGTPGGHYAWLLARHPVLAPGVRAQAIGRLHALGYERLEFPAQDPAG